MEPFQGCFWSLITNFISCSIRIQSFQVLVEHCSFRPLNLYWPLGPKIFLMIFLFHLVPWPCSKLFSTEALWFNYCIVMSYGRSKNRNEPVNDKLLVIYILVSCSTVSNFPSHLVGLFSDLSSWLLNLQCFFFRYYYYYIKLHCIFCTPNNNVCKLNIIHSSLKFLVPNTGQ